MGNIGPNTQTRSEKDALWESIENYYINVGKTFKQLIIKNGRISRFLIPFNDNMDLFFRDFALAVGEIKAKVRCDNPMRCKLPNNLSTVNDSFFQIACNDTVVKLFVNRFIFKMPETSDPKLLKWFQICQALTVTHFTFAICMLISAVISLEMLLPVIDFTLLNELVNLQYNYERVLLAEFKMKFKTLYEFMVEFIILVNIQYPYGNYTKEVIAKHVVDKLKRGEPVKFSNREIIKMTCEIKNPPRPCAEIPEFELLIKYQEQFVESIRLNLLQYNQLKTETNPEIIAILKDKILERQYISTTLQNKTFNQINVVIRKLTRLPPETTKDEILENMLQIKSNINTQLTESNVCEDRIERKIRELEQIICEKKNRIKCLIREIDHKKRCHEPYCELEREKDLLLAEVVCLEKELAKLRADLHHFKSEKIKLQSNVYNMTDMINYALTTTTRS